MLKELNAKRNYETNHISFDKFVSLTVRTLITCWFTRLAGHEGLTAGGTVEEICCLAQTKMRRSMPLAPVRAEPDPGGDLIIYA